MYEKQKSELQQLAAGTVLHEQYIIKKTLGQGGFGITYLGWDMYLEIPVAIKEYFPNGIVTRDRAVSMDVTGSKEEEKCFQDNKARFMREAKTLARFSDIREIVHVHNFFLANNTAYIVMEYVDGITLSRYVKNEGGKLTAEETFRILRPVMEALCRIHKAGCIHRDISPDNIMMLPDGSAKLLDFGAVRDVGNAEVDRPLTRPTEMLVKQGYTPIEQYQGRGSLGPWTDVYAVCATIYYCLTGEVPPDAPGRLLGEEEIDVRGKGAEITEEKENVLKHGMELRGKDRILSMEELCAELFEAGQEEAEDLNTAGNSGDPRKDMGTRKANKSIIAGVLAVCLFFAAGAFFVQKFYFGPGSIKEVKPSLSGQCGDDVYWELNRNSGTLTLSGTGTTWWYRVIEDKSGGASAFADVNDLEEAGISEKWFEGEPEWFEYEGEIRHLIIEDGITELSAALFEDQAHLETIDFGSVVRIWWGCFAGCNSLTEAKLPDSVLVVGSGAFRGCGNLKSVEIPDGSGGIGSQVFVGCLNLKKVVFGEDAVLAGSDLRKDEENPDVYSKNVVYCGYTGSNVEKHAEKYGITFASVGIADDAVLAGRCGEDVRWSLDRGTGTLTLSGSGETYWYRQDLNSENTKQLIEEEYPEEWFFEEPPEWDEYEEDIRYIVIEDGITRLNQGLFSDLGNLESVDFGSITHIEACLDGSSLKKVELPDTVNSVGGYAFSGCEQLETVVIPNGKWGISESCFAGCVNLKSVTFGKDAVPEGNLLTVGDEWRGDALEISGDVIYYGYKGSSAQKNAKEYGIPFVSLE